MSWRLGGESPAFTLVEVLIVIVVISLLIAVIGLVGTRVVHHQKVNLTQTIIKNVKMAIDRFAELDPLKSIYNRKDNVTFGPYPPYTLDSVAQNTVGEKVDPTVLNLEDRLWRDLSGSAGTESTYVDIEEGTRNDDVRALYAYLAIYARDTLSTIPDSAKKPLTMDRTYPPGGPEMVNPTGNGTNPPPADGSAIDVLGIYDAWGVPLDYFLYVKLEWDGIESRWKVTQRIPVLHSWGISREEYDAEINGTDALDPELWIVSDPFPSPAAAAVTWDTGALDPTGSPATSGWARALGAGDERMGYVP